MKKSRFSEHQIINILKEVEAGLKVNDACRQHGISSTTYYQWKSKFGGMEAADITHKRSFLLPIYFQTKLEKLGKSGYCCF